MLVQCVYRPVPCYRLMLAPSSCWVSLRKIKSPKSEEVRESVFVGVAGISISNPFTRIQAKLAERDGALQRQRDR